MAGFPQTETKRGDTEAVPLIPQPAPLSPFGSVFADSVPAAEWDLKDVGEWLDTLGCGEYRTIFENNHITGDILLELTRSDLKQLIAKVGDRLRILQDIRRLQFINEAAATSAAAAVGPAPSSAGYFSSVDTASSDRYDQNSLRFVYPDGTIRFISVANARDATEIKLSAIRRIIPALAESALVNWTITDAEHRPISDPELMARARTPSPTVTLFVRHNPVGHQIMSPRRVPQRTSTATLRSAVSKGRPTSQQVSMNLEEYFPGVDREILQATVRKSMLLSRRLSTIRDSGVLGRRLSNLMVPPSGGETSIAPPGTTTPMRRPSANTVAANRQSHATYSHRFSSLNPLDPPPEEDSDNGDGENTLTSPPSVPLTEEEGMAQLNLGKNMDIDWFRGKVIGSGSFGTVFMGVNKDTGELMAIKEVNVPKSSNNVDEQRHRKMVEALKREITFMKDFDHENIVQYLGFKADSDSMHILLEYVPGGSLHSILNQTGPFEETLIKRYSRQILAGLQYLHDRRIIHRDIKGANVLVDNRGVIKISDFGLSKKAETQQLLSNRQSMQGSAFWMAPEVVRQSGGATVKADIWSFGCLLIELFTGTHPFPQLSQMQAIFKLGNHTRPEIPSDVSPAAEDFLMKTLTVNFEERPTAQELTNHAFLK